MAGTYTQYCDDCLVSWLGLLGLAPTNQCARHAQVLSSRAAFGAQFLTIFHPNTSIELSEVTTNGVGVPVNRPAAAAGPATASSVSGGVLADSRGLLGVSEEGTSSSVEASASSAVASGSAGASGRRLLNTSNHKSSAVGCSSPGSKAGSSSSSSLQQHYDRALLSALDLALSTASRAGNASSNTTAADSATSPSPPPSAPPLPSSGPVPEGPSGSVSTDTTAFVLTPNGTKVLPLQYPAGRTFYVQLRSRDLYGNLQYQEPLDPGSPPANIRAVLCYVLRRKPSGGQPKRGDRCAFRCICAPVVASCCLYVLS